MQKALAQQGENLGELAAECNRRHEAAMRLQQTVASETAVLTQHVSLPRAMSCIVLP